MNYVDIPAKRMCLVCNHIQKANAAICSGCGKSFVFGKQDRKNEPFRDETNISDLSLSDMVKKYDDWEPTHRCLWDGVKPGTPMGMVCNCPKCTITSLHTVYTPITDPRSPMYQDSGPKITGHNISNLFIDESSDLLEGDPHSTSEESSIKTIPAIGPEEWDDLFDQANQLNFGSRSGVADWSELFPEAWDELKS